MLLERRVSFDHIAGDCTVWLVYVEHKEFGCACTIGRLSCRDSHRLLERSEGSLMPETSRETFRETVSRYNIQ